MYKFINEMYDVLTKPLSHKQINENPENKVSGVVEVELSDMIDNDLDNFLDILVQKLIEEGLAMEIDYKLVGCSNNNTVLLLVNAFIEDDVAY